MKYTVYILHLSDNSYYTGYTNNLQRRKQEHSKGRGSRYVKGRRPFKVVYTEEANTRSEAMKRERQIKKFPKWKKELMADKTIKEEELK